ncbi:MAG: hypothetical protein E7342_03315 [Clostridiales bacterium]|nr:hypothetical protein [Clostridiales bacterium]
MKIYGINESEMMNFIEFIKAKGKVFNLSSLFLEYAKKTNKSEGTIRNMYYKIAKKSREDKEFCDKFLDGKALIVNKIEEFSKKEERDVLKEILKRKMEGCSVRSAIFSLANGDNKKALRYQNKYRTADLKLVEELIREIKLENPSLITFLNRKEGKDKLLTLEREINSLVEKIGDKLRKENAFLRLKIEELEKENRTLKGEEERNNLLYFKNNKSIKKV